MSRGWLVEKEPKPRETFHSEEQLAQHSQLKKGHRILIPGSHAEGKICSFREHLDDMK